MISQFTPLSKICSNISRKFSPPKNNKVWFINTGDVLNGKFLHNDISDWSNLPGQAKKAIEKNDILYSEIRPGNGRFAFVCREHTNAVVSTKFMVIKSSKGVYPRYLYHYLTSPRLQEELKSIADSRSGTFPQITFDSISHLEIRLPEMEEQKSISNFLDYLQNKTEINEKTNETLEGIAKALFKSWFIDFDPVKAKAEVRPTGLPDEISNLFPDSFDDSELGMIPKDWEIKSLDEIAIYLNGLALQKYPPKGDSSDIPIIKIAQLRKGKSDESDKCSNDIAEEYVIRDGDILFSWSGSLLVDLWTGGVGALNQHLFKVTSDAYKKWFIFYWTKYHLQEFQRIAKSKATTMGHIQRKHLSEAKILLPPGNLIEKFNPIFDPLLEKQINVRLESKFLFQLRDTILPKLISGQLKILDAEKILEDLGI